MRNLLICCLLTFFTAGAALAVQSTPVDAPKKTPENPNNAASAPPPPTTSKTAAPNPNRPAADADKAGEKEEPKDTKDDAKNAAKPANSHVVGEPYPRDVAVRFLESCTGLNKQMIEPCKCMLNNFQKVMSLDDFVVMANSKKPEDDPRFLKAAGPCIKTNQQ